MFLITTKRNSNAVISIFSVGYIDLLYCDIPWWVLTEVIHGRGGVAVGGETN